MKRALIVSTNKFPQGDAGAIREESFARLFQEIGYDVLVVGLGKATEYRIKQFSGINYLSLRANHEDYLSRFCNRKLYPKRLRKYVLEGDTPYNCIMFVNGSRQTIYELMNYQQHNECILLHDSVEWYSPEEFKYGKLARAYRNKDNLNLHFIDHHFRVIAISKYLESHFNSRNIRTERIPAIMNVQAIEYTKDLDDDVVTFLYAGSPGKKDYLSEIITAFSKLKPEEKSKCKLKIFGVTKEQLSTRCGVDKVVIEDLDNCMSCFGRVVHNEVINQLKYSDFTVLLRPANLRYAKAGFPTKFVESLATGTPVICNLSSDIGLYLSNHSNGLICKDCTADAMLPCIREAISLSIEKRNEMCIQARKTAENCFDYRLYVKEMENIIQ